MTLRKSIIMLGIVLAGMGAYAKSSVVQIKGSDTILNASQSIVEEYMKTNKKARIAVTGGGSGVGIASLINKTADIAMASRNIKSSEVEALKKEGINVEEVVLGYDGITVIINHGNHIKNLDKKTLAGVFAGEITNWKELGGDDAKIVVLSRDSSSGTHAYFKEEILRGGDKKRKTGSPRYNRWRTWTAGCRVGTEYHCRTNGRADKRPFGLQDRSYDRRTLYRPCDQRTAGYVRTSGNHIQPESSQSISRST